MTTVGVKGLVRLQCSTTEMTMIRWFS